MEDEPPLAPVNTIGIGRNKKPCIDRDVNLFISFGASNK